MTRKKAPERQRYVATRHLDILNEGEEITIEPALVAGLVAGGYLRVVEVGDHADARTSGDEPGGARAGR